MVLTISLTRVRINGMLHHICVSWRHSWFVRVISILTTVKEIKEICICCLSFRLCGPSRSRIEKPQKPWPGERLVSKLNVVEAEFTGK